VLDFTVRPRFAGQDEAIVAEVFDADCYGLRALKAQDLPVRRAIDVGAHIGAFARLVHHLYPDAELVCVEADPGNAELLRRNAPFATVIGAACTYESADVQMFSTLHAGGRSTGGGFVAPRGSTDYLRFENAGEYRPTDGTLAKVTLEEIVGVRGWNTVDLLKLDCEGKGPTGGEWSILHNTTLLDRLGTIVGEYHGELRQNDCYGASKFADLLDARFAGWHASYVVGEIGTFRLANPNRALFTS
jgi:FkbM family methyltransferase